MVQLTRQRRAFFMPEIIYLLLIDFLKKSLYEGKWKWSDFEQYVVPTDIFGTPKPSCKSGGLLSSGAQFRRGARVGMILFVKFAIIDG